MKKRIIREKSHRLPEEMYLGCKTVAFTICVKNNKKLFITDRIFEIFEEKLIESLKKHECLADVYLFMPDHLHLIVSGRESNSNVKKSVDLFKQITGYWLSMNLQEFKWQKDYYDHIVRNDKDLQNQIRYVLNNPVRAKLVEDWKKYPYKGSAIYTFDDWE